MYQPAHFGIKDPAARMALAREVIAAHSFASLVGTVGAAPFATHCPLTAQISDSNPCGLVLEGHIARANPHWQAWQDAAGVLVMFHGPHAYLSPSLYEGEQNVPTWNYVAVHVYGRIRVIQERDHLHAVMKRLIAHNEPSYAAQWDRLDAGYRERMLDAIVGFTIEPDSVEVKFKVSQNRQPADRQRVRDAFSQGSTDQQALAAWMTRLGG